MNPLLKEPFLHFAALGAALFALFAGAGGEAQEEGGRVVVTRGHLEQMRIGFARTWHRPPTSEELAGLVEDHVREDILAREAKAVGLDRDDLLIRRRLRQKMEAVLDDVGALAQPTDDDLEAFLAAHPDRFGSESRMSFRQVFLRAERAGEAARILERLRRGEAAERCADASILPAEVDRASPREAARLFGEAFAAGLEAAVVDQWTGPIVSTYGIHLVRVTAREEGRRPPLGGIRDEVRRAWAAARAKQVVDAAYAKLREKYEVVIEPPRRVGP